MREGKEEGKEEGIERGRKSCFDSSPSLEFSCREECNLCNIVEEFCRTGCKARFPGFRRITVMIRYY